VGAGPRTLRALDDPEVLAVCRWLPQASPAGAFSGRHDRIHIGDRHGLVNLWWEHAVVHEGHYVGPPRGGLVPDPSADYSVAMPAGGYLQVEAGVVGPWQDSPGRGRLIRADGDSFDPAEYDAQRPYFKWQYQSMGLDDCRRAILAVQRRRLRGSNSPVGTAANQPGDPRTDAEDSARALLKLVAEVEPTVVCDCARTARASEPSVWPYRGGFVVPNALLGHASAMATMAGAGNPDDAVDVVWRLTGALANPAQIGLVQAAEAAARRLDSSVAGMPDAPLTEEAVALVAAQAVRWHGSTVVPRLPFWTLGWIFLADPLLEELGALVLGPDQLQKALDQADRVRVERASQVWQAANDAAAGLAEMSELIEGDVELRPSDVAGVVDLRAPANPLAQTPPRAAPVPEQRSSGEHQAYSQSIATVLADFSRQ
jgi:hypothetical protein